MSGHGREVSHLGMRGREPGCVKSSELESDRVDCEYPVLLRVRGSCVSQIAVFEVGAGSGKMCASSSLF